MQFLRKAVMVGLEKKLTLYGFNNLTKTLSFNIFDVCYAKSEREKQDYIKYIDEQYNSERLTNILCDVTEMIGATVLNISRQDYEPQGASVNVLIAEGGVRRKVWILPVTRETAFFFGGISMHIWIKAMLQCTPFRKAIQIMKSPLFGLILMFQPAARSPL